MKAKNRERRCGGRVLVEALESRVLMTAVATTYAFTAVADFIFKTTGSHPQGMVIDSQGDIFGVTAQGGSAHYGTVFEVEAGSSAVVKLTEFTGGIFRDGTWGNGISPRGDLVLSGGNLYGITVGGGQFNKGTVFEVTLAGTASTITTLASFNGTDGSYPFAGVVMDAAGNLFGETMGAKKKGYASTVWELATASGATGYGTLAVLGTFSYKDQLNSALVVDVSGNVFGTTEKGGVKKRGSVFEIIKGSGTVTTLVSFQGTNSGNEPRGTLVAGTDGSLIGMTLAGGTKGDGTIFKVTVAGTNSTITTLVNFSSSTGHRPTGSLVVSGGNLYGVTATGGKSDAGTVYVVANVFSLTAGSGTITTLVSFKGKSTGVYPTGALVMGPGGTLWGTTDQGGKDDNGKLFKLVPVEVV